MWENVSDLTLSRLRTFALTTADSNASTSAATWLDVASLPGVPSATLTAGEWWLGTSATLSALLDESRRCGEAVPQIDDVRGLGDRRISLGGLR